MEAEIVSLVLSGQAQRVIFTRQFNKIKRIINRSFKDLRGYYWTSWRRSSRATWNRIGRTLKPRVEKMSAARKFLESLQVAPWEDGDSLDVTKHLSKLRNRKYCYCILWKLIFILTLVLFVFSLSMFFI